ncbi:hypothetical protein PUN28_011017 [Cardiocondyla obscurior]|uniref:Uncharacterized protein n=1 Tax=Cardiocondyla obscurior TaxID=286306 RepID=A0AAW2FKT3_9HYME
MLHILFWKSSSRVAQFKENDTLAGTLKVVPRRIVLVLFGKRFQVEGEVWEILDNGSVTLDYPVPCYCAGLDLRYPKTILRGGAGLGDIGHQRSILGFNQL